MLPLFKRMCKVGRFAASGRKSGAAALVMLLSCRLRTCIDLRLLPDIRAGAAHEHRLSRQGHDIVRYNALIEPKLITP